MKPVSVKVGNARLLRLARFLERSKRAQSHFWFGSWTGSDFGGRQDLSCGTTACAMGWACTLPEFRKLGLHLNKRGIPTFGEEIKYDDSNKGVHAAERLFGISHIESHYLFIPLGHATMPSTLNDSASAKDLAAHIRKFVAEREAAR